MAVTYTPIATSTVTGSSTSTITFSSIPSTYTDIVVVSNCATSSGILSVFGRLNNDSTAIYSWTYLYGNGTTATSGRGSSATGFINGYFVTPATGFDFVALAHIQNYSNSTTFKTVLSRANSTASSYPGAEAGVSLWRSTAAVNRVDLFLTAGNFVAGSTFTLYGIKAA